MNVHDFIDLGITCFKSFCAISWYCSGSRLIIPTFLYFVRSDTNCFEWTNAVVHRENQRELLSLYMLEGILRGVYKPTWFQIVFSGRSL